MLALPTSAPSGQATLQLHEEFLSLLPIVERHAHVVFRSLPNVHREEAIAGRLRRLTSHSLACDGAARIQLATFRARLPTSPSSTPRTSGTSAVDRARGMFIHQRLKPDVALPCNRCQ